MEVLTEITDLHLKVGSPVSSLISVGERKRLLEILALAKTGMTFSLTDAFGGVMEVLETKFAAELTMFKHSPVFARYLRG
jgi:hypothetical protein